MKHSFPVGHPKHGGRKKGGKNRSTVWVLDALKQRGYNYEKELVDALKTMSAPMPKGLQGDEITAWLAIRDVAVSLVDRLIKLAPHIANKPKEYVGLEGIDELVINPFENKKDETK